jgi:hypothetical protein
MEAPAINPQRLVVVQTAGCCLFVGQKSGWWLLGPFWVTVTLALLLLQS